MLAKKNPGWVKELELPGLETADFDDNGDDVDDFDILDEEGEEEEQLAEDGLVVSDEENVLKKPAAWIYSWNEQLNLPERVRLTTQGKK